MTRQDVAPIQFPVGISADRRRIVGADGRPILMQGDAAWSLIANLTPDEARDYLDDRKEKGFNTLIVNLIENRFAKNAPNTIDGIAPFTTPGDFTTPNEEYMRRAEQVLDMALERNFLVLFDVLYLGYPQDPKWHRAPEGWYDEVVANGPERCGVWGRYLAERFGHYPNFIWVIGGDRNPVKATPGVNAVAQALREGGVRDLFTIHVLPECSPLDQPGIDWVDVNLTYTYEIVHKKLIGDWQRTPVYPTLLMETTYEGEHDDSEQQIRRQMWWSVLCGGCGHVFGNNPIWLFDPGWREAMQSPGSAAMRRWGDFFRALPWDGLEPDTDKKIAVGGLGEANGLDRVTTAATSDHRLVVSYLPVRRDLVIDCSTLPDEMRASWFEPATGRVLDEATPIRGHGTVTMRPPFDEDSVLTLTSE